MVKEKDLSGMIVVDEDIPVGVVTDRDLRDKVLAGGLDPKRVRVESIMSFPVFTIKEDDFLSEAVYKMLKNRIHRLAVVNEAGELLGVITDADIIKFQTDTSLYFMKDLEGASNVHDVKSINKRMIEHITNLFNAEVKPKDLVRLISYLNDLVIVKIIKLLGEKTSGEMTGKFAFLVLGSEGRMEQTLKTDQDNAIVYSDELSDKETKLLEDFSIRLIDDLVDIGFPSCPGGIMAKNTLWRRSFSDWKETVKGWVLVPTPDNILNYSMFSDLRTVYGDFDLEKGLKQRIGNIIKEHSVFLAHMANNIQRFKPPLNFMGGFKVERKGKYSGKLDIKMSGIFPLTEGIKVLGLEAGILDGGTSEKIHQMLGRNIVPDDELLEVEAGLNFLIFIRLRNQIREVSRGCEPTNYIDPLELSEIERERLKVSFSVIKSFQRFLGDRYKLDHIAG
jgi:CBS domain-containing protein